MKKILVLVLAMMLLLTGTGVFAQNKISETVELKGKEQEIEFEVNDNGHPEIHVYNNTDEVIEISLYEGDAVKENIRWTMEASPKKIFSTAVWGGAELKNGKCVIKIGSAEGVELSGKAYYKLSSTYDETVFPTPPEGLDDMSEGSIAAYELKALGIMNGDTDGAMRLNDSITRAEAVALISRLHKMLGKEVSLADISYTDMEGHWAYDEVRYAKGAGLISDTDETLFEPEKEVTYMELTSMAVSLLGYGVMAQENGGYPSGYLIAAAETGLSTKLSFSITENATRGKAAIMLFNALDIPMMRKVETEGGNKYVIMDGQNGKEYQSLRAGIQENGN